MFPRLSTACFRYLRSSHSRLTPRSHNNTTKPIYKPFISKTITSHLMMNFSTFFGGNATFGNINKEELKQKIKSKEEFFLIDVRQPQEIQVNGSIETSHNIPLGEVAPAFQLSHDDFEDKYGFEKPSEGDTVIFYCKAGGRSSSAANIISNLGYKNVINYSGSYDDWSSN